MALEWMAWTPATALFFGTIALILCAMTIWQVRAPAGERRGFLPIRTSPGDRLFIGLLGSAFIHLAWIGLIEAPLWWALAVSLVYMAVLMRWG